MLIWIKFVLRTKVQAIEQQNYPAKNRKVKFVRNRNSDSDVKGIYDVYQFDSGS